jgi:hypothetical protein
MITPSRRGFLIGLFAAPAIVRASSLMPLSFTRFPDTWFIDGSKAGSFMDGSAAFPFATLNQAIAIGGAGDTFFISNTHIEIAGNELELPGDQQTRYIFENCGIGTVTPYGNLKL